MPGTRPSTFVLVLLTSLYFSQGLPSGLLAHALPALLREYRVPLEYIGYLKLLALPWMLKFLWAPFVDRYHFRRTGPHRSWILPMQLLVIALLLGIARLDPEMVFSSYLPAFLAALLLLNLCCATQDVATDGLAVKLLPSQWRGLGNSIQVSGYKLGLILGGGVLLVAIDRFGWAASFCSLAALLALSTLPVLRFREAPGINEPADAPPPTVPAPGFLWRSNRDFFRQPGMGRWLAVLLSYKLADALGSAMIKPLLVDAGLTLSGIGTLTLVASLAGMAASVAGGLLYYRLGPRVTLPGFGLLQAIGIAAYALVPLGWTGTATLYGIALFEQAADGMSTVVLFALMMDQCRANHEGADYSLQACCQVILAGLAGAASGWVAGALGYELHFLASGLLGLLVLLPAWHFLRDRPPPPLITTEKPGVS